MSPQAAGLPKRRRIAFRLVNSSWETLVAFFCLLGSIPRILGTPPPQSIDVLFPTWLRVVWGLTLLCGGIGVLVGVTRARATIEQPSLLLLAGATTAYAVAILGIQGFNGGGILAAAIVAAISCACVIELVRERLLSWLLR